MADAFTFYLMVIGDINYINYINKVLEWSHKLG